MVSNKAGRSKHRTATTQGHVDSHCFWRICLAEQRAAKISGVAPGQFWNLETARFSTTDARTHLQSLTSRLVTRQPASQNLCSSISGSPPVDRQHRRSSMSHRRSSMPDPRCSICEGPRPSLDSNPAALRIADLTKLCLFELASSRARYPGFEFGYVDICDNFSFGYFNF